MFGRKILDLKRKSCSEAMTLKGWLLQTQENLWGLQDTDERDVDRDSASRNGGSSVKRNGRMKENIQKIRVRVLQKLANVGNKWA